MQYIATAHIKPARYFGLPDGERVIGPSGSDQTWEQHEFTPDGSVVRYGSLSQYRSREDAIAVTVRIGSGTAEIRDNIISLRFEAPSDEEARIVAADLLARFVRHLSVQRARLFWLEGIKLADEVGRPVHSELRGGSTWMYNLSKQRSAIVVAASRTNVTDICLDKALVYFEHAQFLIEASSEAVVLSSKSLLITSAYLNMWKAITAILGDPTTDSDYQSRCRRFGFPKRYWKERIEPLKNIRDKFDVAHYSLDLALEEPVRRAFWESEQVCRECIFRYTEYLQTGIANDE